MNDNKTGVRDLTVWDKQNPSVHSTGLIFVLMPHLNLRLSVNCSQRERTNRHSQNKWMRDSFVSKQ